MLEHKGIVSENILWRENLGINLSDRCLQFASISFDASVWEIYMSLFNGASLYILEKSIKEDRELFKSYMMENKITVASLTPVFAEYLDENSLSHVRLMVTGGSETNAELISRFNKKARYLNSYGPTEASVCATIWDTKEFTETNIVSIGKPIANTSVLILGKHLELQPIGVPGELCIGGVGLARAYLRDEKLTAEKFIEHPFKAGERIYRTGDLARWLPDGNIEFLGRIDHQVKIRGFRIELGEIESTILSHEFIRESVVLAREDNNEKYLCAYIVCNAGYTEEDLRSYLSKLLSDYMIPGYFVELDEMPLTSNGKINRKALPVPEIKAGADYVSPANETEERLVRIWSEVLNIHRDEISVKANFFTIGGHSLKAASCMSALNNCFNSNIPLIELFKNPTIVQLANCINKSSAKINTDDDSVVLIKEGTNDENVFLIHDGSGEIDGYIEFCKQANDNINYWGIKAGNLKRNEPFNITIEELSKRYLTSIRKIQKTGEYNIAGWSLGGTIAYEIVRQLEQENEKIRFFGIFDSKAPEIKSKNITESITIKSELEWLGNYFDDEILREFITETDLQRFWINLTEYLRKLEGAENIIRREIIKNIGFNIKEDKKVSIEELITFMNFSRSLSKACSNYIPENMIKTKINYFKAEDSNIVLESGWNNCPTGGNIAKKAKGNHYSMFTLPNVKNLYNQFYECFNGSESKT